MTTDFFHPDKRAYVAVRKSASCAHKLDYHFVFVTKYRRKVLTSDAAEALIRLIGETCQERNWLLLGLSVQPDHIHLIVGLKPDVAPASVAHDLKGVTSYRLLGMHPELADVLGSAQLWGGGYSVETMGRSNVAQLDAYLQTQAAHHAESSIDAI